MEIEAVQHFILECPLYENNLQQLQKLRSRSRDGGFTFFDAGNIISISQFLLIFQQLPREVFVHYSANYCSKAVMSPGSPKTIDC